MSYQSLPVSVEYDDFGFYDGSDEDNLPWTFHREDGLAEHLADMAECWRGRHIAVLTYWPSDQGYKDTLECYDYVYRGSDGKLRLLDISENMGVNGVSELEETPEALIDFLFSRMDGGEQLLPVQVSWGTQSSNYKPPATDVIERAKDRVFEDKGGQV